MERTERVEPLSGGEQGAAAGRKLREWFIEWIKEYDIRLARDGEVFYDSEMNFIDPSDITSP